MSNRYEEGQSPQSPEQRTREFFTKPYQMLEIALRNMNIAGEDGRMIQITHTKGFSRAQNEKGVYKPIIERSMQAGTLWVCPYPRFDSNLSLILGENGTCVQIVGAMTQGENGGFEGIPVQKGISQALNLQVDQQVTLEFRDMESNTLWITPLKENNSGKEGLSQERAEEMLFGE